jgi:hypothetical protein
LIPICGADVARNRLHMGFSTHSHTFPQGSPSVLLTLLLRSSDTKDSMARYSAFLGRRVEVHYRAGDILLPASGTFVADSGRSIFLEQHLSQRGQSKYFRWEIPYQYIVRLEAAKPESEDTPEGPGSRAGRNGAVDILQQTPERVAGRSAAAARAAAGAAPMLSLNNPPETA